MSDHTETSTSRICCFCGLADDNEIRYGKFYEHNGIVTHYYCLLLSSCMEQKGEDDEGILGFLDVDIQKELRRGKKLLCSYCKNHGATLGCNNVKCTRKFHYPCGLKAGSLHQFFGEFRSFCVKHRPKQKIDRNVKNEVKNSGDVTCYICYDKVEPDNITETLWAPCCKKNAWFHRTCVQQLAMSAGYFFKCPLCNDKKIFQEAMLEFGIFIPSQDASWELVPNAFQELLYRHDQCDAATCICPKGRKHTSNNARWELILCRTCGSQGIHMGCGQLKWVNPIWECTECISILRKSKKGSGSGGTDSPTQSNSESEDNDSDISVGTDRPLPISSNTPSCDSEPCQSRLSSRPAPRSVKLRQRIREEKIRESMRLQKNNVVQTDTTMHSNAETVEKPKEELKPNNGTCAIKSSQPPEDETSLKCSKDGDQLHQPTESRPEEDIIMIDSDDDVVEIPCDNSSKNTSTRNTSQTQSMKDISFLKDLLKADSSACSFHSSIANNTSDAQIGNSKGYFSSSFSQDLPQSDVTQDQEHLNKNSQSSSDSIANIKIVNVTSLAPEEFQKGVTTAEEQERILFPSALDRFSQQFADVSRNNDFKPKHSIQQSGASELHLKRKSENERVLDPFALVSTTETADGQKKLKRDKRDSSSPRKALAFNDSIYEGLPPSFGFVETSVSGNELVLTEFREKYECEDAVVQRCLLPATQSDCCKESSGNNMKKPSIAQTTLQCSANINNNNDDDVSTNLSSSRERGYVETEQNCSTGESGNFKQIYNKNSLTGTNVLTIESDEDAPVFVSGYILNTNQVTIERDSRQTTNDHECCTVKHGSTPTAGATAINCDGDAGTDPARLPKCGRTVNDEDWDKRKRPFADSSHDCSTSKDWAKTGTDAATNIESTSASSRHSGDEYTACDLPRLIPEYIHLSNLRFRVGKSNDLQMILYDKFYVNINMDAAMKQDGRLNATVRKRVEAESPEEEIEISSKSVRGEVLHNLERINKHLNTAPSISSVNNDKCKYNTVTSGHVTNYRDDTKENLDPVTTIASRDTSNNSIPSVSVIENNVTFSTNVDSQSEQENSVQRVSKSVEEEVNNRWNDLDSINLADSDSDITNVIKVNKKMLQNGCGCQNFRDKSNNENIFDTKESSLNSPAHDKKSADDKRTKMANNVNPSVQSLSSDYVSSSTTGKCNINHESYNRPKLAQRTLSSKDSTNCTTESNSGSEIETCCTVSIDLNKVQNLVDANPVLFSKEEKESDERCYEEVNFVNKHSDIVERISLRNRHITKSVLSRSKSLNRYNFSPSTHTTVQLANYSNESAEGLKDSVPVQKTLIQEIRPIDSALLNNTRRGLKRTSKHFEKQCVLDR